MTVDTGMSLLVGGSASRVPEPGAMASLGSTAIAAGVNLLLLLVVSTCSTRPAFVPDRSVPRLRCEC